MHEASSSTPEIDLSQYPDLVGCNIMPQAYMHYVVTEVEITDAEGRQVVVEVPDEAVKSLGVHHLYHGLPEGTREMFQDQLAAGMVACRVIERFDDQDMAKIELPTRSEVSEVLVPSKQLARKV